MKYKYLTVGVILSLSGCKATDMITGNNNIRALEPDPSDICDVYRDPLRQLNNEYKSKVFNSMLTGAVLGAVAGAAVSSREDRSKGILTGALTGIFAGGVAGEQMAASEQRKSVAEVEADLSVLAAGENKRVSRVTAGISDMYDCRANEYVALSERFKTGEVSKADAIETKSRIDAKVSADEQLIEYVLTGAEERLDSIVKKREDLYSQSDKALSDGSYFKVKTTGGLNVRKAPVKGAEALGQLASNSIVKGEKVANQPWVKVAFSGTTGFASSNYLEVTEERPGATESGEIKDFSNGIAMTKDLQKKKESELKRQKELAAALILG